MDTLTLINVASFGSVAAGVLAILAGTLVYVRDTARESNRAFLLTALSVGFFDILLGLFELPALDQYAHILVVALYLSAVLVPLALHLFAITLASERSFFSTKRVVFSFIPIIVAFFCIATPGFIVDSVGGREGIGREILFGGGYYFFVAFLLGYLLTSLIILFRKYRESAGIFRVELAYIFWSIISAVVVILVANLFMPQAGAFSLFWLGPVAAALVTLFIGYLLVRFNFWNPKLVVTEFFTSVVVLILITEVFLARSFAEFAVKSLIATLVIVASFFLVRSVGNEIKAKEEVEHLLKELAEVNDELHALDEKKSEFISIASHHLRDPLTVIKGYASMILEGTYGALESGLAEAIGRIFESSNRLVTIIDDFLNVARIESGEMIYEFATVDMKTMLGDLAEELMPVAMKAGRTFKFMADGKYNYRVRADAGKIRQVISNLVDNAIKYNAPNGSIRVMMERRPEAGGDKIRIAVTDSGIGMNKDALGKIFVKFSRAEGVSRIYTEGSGLGLYVAKEILKKHNGRIWAESEGVGKGSTFFIELAADE